MKKVEIELGILVRMSKIVIVEVPGDFPKPGTSTECFMSDVYDADDGEGFHETSDWGCKEATHQYLGKISDKKATMRLNDDGNVEEILPCVS